MLADVLWRWVLAELARGECRPLAVCACAVDAAGLPGPVRPLAVGWAIREYWRLRAKARATRLL